MASLDVRNFSIGEELLDSRHCIIGNISGLSTTNKKRRSVICEIVRFLEWEIRHIVQRAADDRERDPEFESIVFLRPDQVREKELANWKRLCY
jgi:hypothetical protein